MSLAFLCLFSRNNTSDQIMGIWYNNDVLDLIEVAAHLKVAFRYF